MQLGSRRYMQPGSELLLRAPQGTVFSAQTSHPKQLMTFRERGEGRGERGEGRVPMLLWLSRGMIGCEEGLVAVGEGGVVCDASLDLGDVDRPGPEGGSDGLEGQVGVLSGCP
jgi:hypothetical protein